MLKRFNARIKNGGMANDCEILLKRETLYKTPSKFSRGNSRREMLKLKQSDQQFSTFGNGRPF